MKKTTLFLSALNVSLCFIIKNQFLQYFLCILFSHKSWSVTNQKVIILKKVVYINLANYGILNKEFLLSDIKIW